MLVIIIVSLFGRKMTLLQQIISQFCVMIGVLLLLLALHPVDSLSTTPTSSESPPVERVAIIGSGIAGLSLAHALTNSPELAKSTPGSKIQVSLFDSRPSFDFNAGAGVQLNG